MNNTKEYFLKNKIVKNDNSKALNCFSEICPDFTIYQNIKPSIVIKEILEKYQQLKIQNNNTNGKVFEFLLASILINEKILPFYMQAKVAFVPNVDYDILLFTKDKGPIVLSAKTSLRERYKQADLEAIALKYVHRKAECYLVTNDEKEAKNIEKKVKSGDVIGINKVILANSSEFDALIKQLQQEDLKEAGSIEIITSKVFIK